MCIMEEPFKNFNTSSLIERNFRERLVYDSLDLIILRYLHKSPSPRRAKDIMDFCSNSFGINLKDGVIYALLFKMEMKKLISGKSMQAGEYTARYYKLSNKGRQTIEMYIETYREEVLAFINLVQTILL